MLNKLKKRVALISLILMVLFLNGCDFLGMFKDDETDITISLNGSWAYSSASTSADKVVTDTVIEAISIWDGVDYGYDAEIQKSVVGSYNAGSSSTDLTNCGYFVVLYDGGAGDGKYGVIRWNNYITANDETTVEFSEGYSNGTYYDTVEAAEDGMDDTYFTYYSTLYKL